MNMKTLDKTPADALRVRKRYSLRDNNTRLPTPRSTMDLSDSDNQNSGGGMSRSPVEVRLRRAHKKSRKGCKSCKEQRKKCDERQPRCSRCNRLDQPCNYPEPRGHDRSPLPGPASTQSESPTLGFVHSPPSLGLEVPQSQFRSHSFGASPSPRPESGSPAYFGHASSFSRHSQVGTPTDRPVLGPSDLELLGHFLEHTSRHQLTEIQSHYAWRVGIPNLAFRHAPLMHSVLSVSALCLCFDSGCSPSSHATNFDPFSLSPSPYPLDALSPQPHSPAHHLSPPNLSRSPGTSSGIIAADTGFGNHIIASTNASLDIVARRLNTAMGHHAASISSTLDNIADGRVAADTEAAFINAYLMPIYSIAVYRVQRWVYDTRAHLGLEQEFEPPALLSWIGLVRTTGTAVVGLMRSRVGLSTPTTSPYDSPNHHMRDDDGRVEEPDETTMLVAPFWAHPLYPLLSSTASTALDTLSRRLDGELRMALPTSATSSIIAALTVLTRVKTAIVCSLETPCPDCIAWIARGGDTAPELAAAYPPGVEGIPEWIRGCLMPREVGGTPHKGIVRLIIGWANRVSQEFVDLLDEAVRPGAEGEWTLEQRVAVDIFAHWLVFVMLLNEVWWMGSFGRDELRRLVEVWERRGGGVGLGGQEWWPREMLRSVEAMEV